MNFVSADQGILAQRQLASFQQVTHNLIRVDG